MAGGAGARAMVGKERRREKGEGEVRPLFWTAVAMLSVFSAWRHSFPHSRDSVQLESLHDANRSSLSHAQAASADQRQENEFLGSAYGLASCPSACSSRLFADTFVTRGMLSEPIPALLRNKHLSPRSHRSLPYADFATRMGNDRDGQGCDARGGSHQGG